MPVTFKVAPHDANPTKLTESMISSKEQLVNGMLHGQPGVTPCQEVLQSSYVANPWFHPRANGFIDTVMESYNSHHHLIIRPDDIWCAILNQFNFYVNANAESLRSKFVAHEGKKQLAVVVEGTRYTVDFGWMANEMGRQLKENILDETLHDWVIPNFTTTTPNDIVICSVLLMSTLQKYFDYNFCCIDCGIPSITLLGEKDDYLSILFRLDRFEEFGEQPTMFATFLRPILKEFVNAFDYQGGHDNSLPNPDFWNKICHRYSGGSGPTFLCGWITAFAVWNQDGKWQGGDMSMVNQPIEGTGWGSRDRIQLFWGNLRYPLVDIAKVPKGYCQVPVQLDDNGEKFDCKMIAGHVGMHISSSRNAKASETSEETVKDTVQPAMEWFMFIQKGFSRPIDQPHGVYEQQQHEKIRARTQNQRSWREILSKITSLVQHVWSVKRKGKSSA
ncbi:hypothetical protein FRC17_010234 [Serendipita sp. 399]|nr:hypothetical protein FRC17_010234 [Serendipita sp. 399]